jgi:hypothetical protein
MAGPVPAIHDLCRRPENVDARDKPGHHECVATAAIPSLTQNAADVAVRRICPLTLRAFRSARGAYFFSANTQITPPCGTLDSMPILLVASASWMRCASTPHPDWIAMYCVPSIS